MKKGKQYKVLSAKYDSCYHYHGSWFEYTWNMVLESDDGEQISGYFDTWRDYKSLNNKTVKFGNTDIFEVVE